MKKGQLLLSIILSLFFNSARANFVDVSYARQVAVNFYTHQTGRTVANANLTYAMTDNTPGVSGPGDTVFYVFNMDTHGFVMVSAEDKVQPVLGYGTTGAFVSANMNTNVQFWMQKGQAQISAARHYLTAAPAEVTEQWTVYYSNRFGYSRGGGGSAGPLCQTTWNQEPYYNAVCPYDTEYDERCVTGCVATAMSQIMRYWSYPPAGTGSHSYYDYPFGDLYADFATTTYNWGNMPYSITGNNNDIAVLNYDCGVAVEMNYGCDATGGSGAWVISSDVPPGGACAQTAYSNYFGYNPLTIQGLLRQNYSDSDWINMLEANLDSARPIQYAGWDESGFGGHTWVCDGYDANEYFHMNWGWGGQDDGFYSLNDLDAAMYNFIQKEEAIIGIEPLNIAKTKPVASFYSSATSVCPGSTISFTNNSSGYPTGVSWTFQGGSPSTSIENDPSVLYTSSGTYTVTLIATNAIGSDTLTQTAYITVLPVDTLPLIQGFEDSVFPPASWQSVNLQYDLVSWQKANVGGYGTSSASAFVNCFNDTSIGAKHLLMSPPMNFDSAKVASLSYDYAYARYDTTQSFKDSLVIIYSTDCGATFNTVAARSGATLATVTDTVQHSFVPDSAQWKTDNIDLTFLAGFPAVQIGLEVINGYGNNVYVDNINISATASKGPIVDFSGNPLSVTAGNTVDFTDLTGNSPTAWNWSFPGGIPSVSIKQNPTGILYNTPGSYNVTLTATNANGVGTVTKIAYITVTASATAQCDTVKPAYGGYIPGQGMLDPWFGYYTGTNSGFGTTAFANVFTPPSNGSYLSSVYINFIFVRDHSDSDSITVNVWDSTGVNGSPGNVIASQTLLYDSIKTSGPTLITFQNPAIINGKFYVGVSFNIADTTDTMALQTDTTNLSNPGYGWLDVADSGWEPFSHVRVINWAPGPLDIIMHPVLCSTGNTLPPVADFNGAPTIVTTGSSVVFTDLSYNSPTSWSWSFPGGTPATSTAQSPPPIVYNTSGVYNVTLIVANSKGIDTLTKADYIFVSPYSSYTCDTFTNFSLSSRTLYRDPKGGYYSGTNADGYNGLAEEYTAPGSSLALTAVGMYFGAMTIADPSTWQMQVNVYDATGSGGSPGNILSNSVMYAYDIGTDSFGYVYLNNQPTLSGKFFVGIIYNYDPGDSLAIYTSPLNTTKTNTGYVLNNNVWDSWPQALNDTSTLCNGIFPIFCTQSVVPVYPDVDFIGTPTTLNVGGKVNFTDLSSDNPTSWSWYFPGGTPSTSTEQNPTNIVYNTPGMYDVTLTAGYPTGAYTAGKYDYIVVVTQPVASFTSNTRTSCIGSPVEYFDLSTNYPTSWNWSFPGGTPSTSTEENPVIAYYTPGIYPVTLTVSNMAGSSTDVISAYITINQPPQVNYKVTSVGCPGTATGDIDVTVTGGTPPYTYSWNTRATTENLDNIAAGTYSLSVFDNAGCEVLIYADVTQPFAMILSVVTTPSSCGKSNGTAIISASGGIAPYTYLWSDYKTGAIINNLAPGIYYVTVTDSVGCSEVASTLVGGTDPPNVVVVPVPTSCGQNNGAVSALVTNSIGAFTYLWNNGLTSDSLTGLPPGPYSVNVSDSGCVGSGFGFVDSSALITVTDTTTLSACNLATGSATAIASGGSGYTYSWSNGQTGATDTSIAAGNYTVTVTATGGCMDSIVVSVSNLGGPTDSIVTTNVRCYGDSNGTITLIVDSDSAYTYIWSNDTTLQNLTNLAKGVYGVTITDTTTGCISANSIVITQPPLLNSSTAVGNVTCNGDSNGTAAVLVSGGTYPYTYFWSDSTFDSTVAGLDTGTYIVTVTDLNGCMNIDTAAITAPSALAISLFGSDPGCITPNGAVSADVSGGIEPYSYSWNVSPNDTNYVISGLGAGIYIVTATDGNKCVVTDSLTLSPPPVILLADTTTISCKDSSGTASVTPSNGIGPYTYSWNTGSKDSAITHLAPGPYMVTVADSLGCITTDSMNVGQGVSIKADVANVTGCYGSGKQDGEIILKVAGGTGNYIYNWNNGQSSSILSSLAIGSYTVTVTDTVAGCQAIGTFIVNEPPPLHDTVLTTPTREGDSIGKALAVITGGLPPYNYIWSNGNEYDSVIYGLAAGTYGLTIVDADTCVMITSFVITEIQGIQNPGNGFKFEIFPNPNNGIFQVSISIRQQNNCSIQVLDALGAKVYEIDKNNLAQDNFTIDLSMVSSGTYFVRLVSDDYNVVRKVTVLRQ